ncbi:hypothetical protein CR513_33979, partial [Mucuna pruriens]
MDHNMIDAACGGALMNKMPAVVRHLISNMASNIGAIMNKVVNKVGAVDNLRLENQLIKLTSLVRQLVISQHQQIPPVKICEICTSVEHPTDMCPTLWKPIRPTAVSNSYRSSSSQRQYVVPRFGPMPNMPASNHNYYQQSGPRYLALLFQQQQQQMPTQNNSPSMEEWMKFQQNMNATMHDLKMQISQLANSSAGSGNLPTQTIPNPKGGNVSVVTLRSGKELQVAPRLKPNPTDTESKPDANSRVQQQARTTPLPFPSRSLSARKPETNEDLLKMFRQVEINIMLLDAIKQVPKYAKFLKELCIHKRKKLKAGAEVRGVLLVFIQKEVIVGTQLALPRKCRDPKIFSVPCTIGGCTFVDAMLDLGASINVMLESIYKSLNFGDLKATSIVI